MQVGTDDNDGTARVVDTLTQKVLTEAALLTLQTIRQGLKRTVGLRLHCAGFLRVIEQGVDSFLKHALFITHNHIGSLNLDQTFKAVIADDDTTVEIVEVGSGETTAIKGHQRTQFRRNDRHHLDNHPFGTVLGALAAVAESLENMQALKQILFTLLGSLVVGTVAQFVRFLVQVDLTKQIIQSLCTHLGNELVGIIVGQQAVVSRKHFVNNFKVLLFCQESFVDNGFGTGIIAMKGYGLVGNHTRLNDNIFLVIDNSVDFLGLQP